MSASWPPSNWKPAKRRPDRPISAPELTFANEFFKNGGDAAAAVAISYPNIAEGNRRKYGRALLDRKRVQDELQRIRSKASRILDISAERIMQETAKVAFANLPDILDVNPDGSATVNLNKLDDKTKAALADYTVDEYTEGRGKNASKVKKHRGKMHDKLKAIELLARMQGLLIDVHKHDVSESLIERLQQGRARIRPGVIDVAPNAIKHTES
jgi:phage terminase small subunit